MGLGFSASKIMSQNKPLLLYKVPHLRDLAIATQKRLRQLQRSNMGTFFAVIDILIVLMII
jgi:hypothetical protein